MALEGSLDLFVLMVEYVSGGILLSIILWALVLLITGILGRMSIQSILIILLTYFAVAMIGYFGFIAALLLTLFVSWYMSSAIINYFSSIR
jgi:hypothetical protein